MQEPEAKDSPVSVAIAWAAIPHRPPAQPAFLDEPLGDDDGRRRAVGGGEHWSLVSGWWTVLAARISSTV
ncbi:hypothetical protein SNARM312S_04731 [Streptomyces narbonensis]